MTAGEKASETCFFNQKKTMDEVQNICLVNTTSSSHWKASALYVTSSKIAKCCYLLQIFGFIFRCYMFSVTGRSKTQHGLEGLIISFAVSLDFRLFCS
jgi:hypothetical protein